jgi:hypothetical protein
MDHEESVSGFKRRGGWVDVVEHGERITQALRDLATDADVATDVPDEALEEFDDWRPKSHERLDEDVNEKRPNRPASTRARARRPARRPTRTSSRPARNSRTPTTASTRRTRRRRSTSGASRSTTSPARRTRRPGRPSGRSRGASTRT